MGALLGFFGAGPARLQALLIGTLVLAVAFLGVVTWAMLERSGRLSAKVELVRAQDQAKVWESAADRCTASVENAAKIGQGAVDATRALLVKVEAANAKNAPMLAYIAGIVSKPPPTRPDGKPKDCGDALGEIREKAGKP